MSTNRDVNKSTKVYYQGRTHPASYKWRVKLSAQAFRRHNFSLGPDAISFIEDICASHLIDDEQLEASVAFFVDEYSKQDGWSHYINATMKVSLPILKRIYSTFQVPQDQSLVNDRLVGDAESRIDVVNAFEMPLWHWSIEKNGFDRASRRLTMSGEPDSRILAIRDRLLVIRQVILRNEHFTATAVPSRDRETLLELRSTKDLLGRSGSDFLLFGILTRSKEGTITLEDLDGKVELDVSLLEVRDGLGEGFFTDGCLALVEGTYTDEEVFRVSVVGHPPCERRTVARSVHGHVDFVGKGAVTLLEEAHLATRLAEEHPDITFLAFSDLWLDHPETLLGLRRIFESCIENAFVPKAFIFCGNFSSKGVIKGSGKDIIRYQEGFDLLADVITSFPIILRSSHFIFVPGPLDLVDSAPAIFPKKPLMPFLTSRLRSKLPRVHFASNPCRIMFCGQEIVVFRDDAMARIMRNRIMQKEAKEETDLRKFLVQTVIDQCHLTPFNVQIQPVYWDFDHALRLYPMPSALVLADKYERFELKYEGSQVFNPGSFLGNSCGFTTYYPAHMRAEASEMPSPDGP